MKELVRAAAIRGLRTTCQELGTTIPAGLVITPVMVQHAGWPLVYIVLAWLGTGILGGFSSFLTGLATGLPEAKE